LLGVLDSLQERDSGARIGMFSYGSGASAEMLSGTVAPDARGRMARHRIEAALAARHEISVDELDAAAEAVFRGLTAEFRQQFREEDGVVVQQHARPLAVPSAHGLARSAIIHAP